MNSLEALPVDEYFLDIASKKPEGDGEYVIICPASSQLHVFRGAWRTVDEADDWLDSAHFGRERAYGGSECHNEVDYDMHGVIRMEDVF